MTLRKLVLIILVISTVLISCRNESLGAWVDDEHGNQFTINDSLICIAHSTYYKVLSNHDHMMQLQGMICPDTIVVKYTIEDDKMHLSVVKGSLYKLNTELDLTRDTIPDSIEWTYIKIDPKKLIGTWRCYVLDSITAYPNITMDSGMVMIFDSLAVQKAYLGNIYDHRCLVDRLHFKRIENHLFLYHYSCFGSYLHYEITQMNDTMMKVSCLFSRYPIEWTLIKIKHDKNFDVNNIMSRFD